MPGALGIREAGGVAIFRLLGLDESAGLALWLLRRAWRLKRRVADLVIAAGIHCDLKRVHGERSRAKAAE